jgi:hypothetical protein
LLVGNRSGDAGGAISNAVGATATITGCTISQNVALYGGGIGSLGNLAVLGSTITGNRANIVGGGIGHDPFSANSGQVSLSTSVVSGNTAQFGGGGMYSKNGALFISDSAISGNSTENYNGGGVSSFNGTLSITRSTIFGNAAPDLGGGVFGAAPTVTDSSIVDNTANYGGGIYHTGHLTVIGSTISDNRASAVGGGIGHDPFTSNGGPLTISHTVIRGNAAQRGGGGIFNRFGSVSIADSTIADNETFEFDGGGVSSGGMLTMSRTTVSGNSAPDRGGGMFVKAATIASSEISNNSADYGGGVGHDGALTITGSTISGNQGHTGAGIGHEIGYSANVSLTNCTLSGNVAESAGGGIFNQGSLTISHCTIADNAANEFGGGGIGSSGGGTLTHSIVARNLGPGGARSDISGLGVFALTFSLIGDHTDAMLANNGGNQIGTAASPINPLLVPLTSNGGPAKTHALLPGSPAINAGSPTAVAGIAGIPQFDERGQPFERVAGGRIDIGAYERQSSPGNQSLIVDTLADENDSEYGAGDLSLREAIGLANGFVGGDDVISFHPAIHGGVIVLTRGELSIHDAMTIVGPGAGALVIDASGNDPTPATNNGDGSRIFTVDDDDPILINVHMSGLTLTGGDVGFGGGAILNQENLSVSDSMITGNAAAGLFNYGGGVRNLYGASLTIARSTISHNSARTGGGVANSYGDLVIQESTLLANTAFAGGGALDNRGDLALPFTARIVSSTISGNTAQGSGGGIATSGLMSISHSTITNNQGQPGYGSGVASEGTSVITQTNVNHAIVAGNINSDVDFANDDGNSFQSGGYNLIGIGNPAAYFNLPGDQTGVLNPMLGNLADNGGPTMTHALLSGSPAIDAGDPAAVAGAGGVSLNDQRGFAFSRVMNGRIDVGAFEAGAASADFDVDLDVNGFDFLAWQRGFGSTGAAATSANGNADADSDVDGDDLAVWQSQFGDNSAAVAAAKPAAASAITADSAFALSTAAVDAAMAWLDSSIEPTRRLSRPKRR